MSRDERYIYSRVSGRQIPDLLQMLFVGELLAPSPCLWVISPWISDIVIIDNTANQFLTVEPAWEGRRVRFSTVIGKLAALGTTVHVATRYGAHNDGFVYALREYTKTQRRLQVHRCNKLHAKGILGADFYLSGSMNFTFRGISINDEMLHYHTNEGIVAENRVYLTSWLGGTVT